MKLMKFGATLLALSAALTMRAQADFINGDFQTGDLTGWTQFTTANGSIGQPLGYPNVVLFNTNGSGDSLAAHFNVGEVVLTVLQEGGGIGQFVNLSAGSHVLTADIASVDDPEGPNAAAGLFTLLVNGTAAGSTDLGPFSMVTQTLRGALNVSFSVPTDGSYDLQIEITRPFLGGSSDLMTPQQYLDNVHVTGSVITTPEPSSFSLLVFAAIGVLILFPQHRRLKGPDPIP